MVFLQVLIAQSPPSEAEVASQAALLIVWRYIAGTAPHPSEKRRRELRSPSFWGI